MTCFSTSSTQCDRRLDPFQCRDRAQAIRSRYIHHLARLMWRGVHRKFATGFAILSDRRAGAGSC